MVILRLFAEFFKIGLFALGGGPATLPFLFELTGKYDWFTREELTNMIAVGESTPGPVGVNMATYAGYNAAGISGSIVATTALVLPSVVIIIIIARFMKSFNTNKYVQSAFLGIRPAVAALIAVAIWNVIRASLFVFGDGAFELVSVKWWLILLTTVMFLLMQIKKLAKLHPAVWLLGGCVIGIVFSL